MDMKWSRRIFAVVLCAAMVVNGQFVEVLAAETDDDNFECSDITECDLLDSNTENELILNDENRANEISPDDIETPIKEKVLEDITESHIEESSEFEQLLYEKEESAENMFTAEPLGSATYSLTYTVQNNEAIAS